MARNHKIVTTQQVVLRCETELLSKVSGFENETSGNDFVEPCPVQTTSQWTLDYPPFFAYFEHLLSIPAYIVDPKITQLDNLEYEEWSVVAFQRTTVILTELLVLGSALLL